MRYTLAEYRAALAQRLVAPEAAMEATLDRCINDAYLELIQRAKQAHSRRLRTLWEIDLISGQQKYEHPPELEALESVMRMDVTGGPVPVVRSDAAREFYTREAASSGDPSVPTSAPYTYQEPEPGVLELMQAPTADLVDGLLLFGWPRPIPLQADREEPLLPECLQEHVVAAALVRLRSMGDIRLANERAVLDYIGRMDLLLVHTLAPDHHDTSGTDLADEGEIW